MGFDAFISYARKSSTDEAVALKQGLEAYARRWNRARSTDVFLDDASLSAAPSLEGTLSRSLMESEWLIVLLSEAAAASPWVDQEVAWWLEHKSPERMLLVQIDGRLAWTRGEGFTSDSTCVPPALRQLAVEPRWVDVTWFNQPDSLRQDDPRFTEVVLQLFCPIHGLERSQAVALRDANVRRAKRLTRGAITALSTLLTLALVASAIAVNQRSEAVAQRDQAIRLAMVSQAHDLVGTNDALAMAFSIEATVGSDSTQALRTLTSAQVSRAQAAGQQLGAPLRGHASTLNALALSHSGDLLASGDMDGRVVLWDIASRSQRAVLAGPYGYIWAVAFDPTDQELASVADTNAIQLWNVRQATARLAQPLDLQSEVQDLLFTPDGRLLVATAHGIYVVDAGSGVVQGRVGDTEVDSLELSRDGTRLVTFEGDGSVRLRDPDTLRALATLTGAHCGENCAGYRASFSPDGSLIAAESADSRILLWDGASLAPSRPIEVPDLADGFSWVAGDDVAVAVSPGRVQIWDTKARKQVGRAFTVNEGEVTRLVASTDGKTLVTGGEDGLVRLWDLSRPYALSRVIVPTEAVSANPAAILAPNLALSPDGSLVAVTRRTAIMIRSTSSGDLVKSLPIGLGLEDLAFSPDGATLAALDRGRARAWRTSDWAELSVPDRGDEVDAVVPADGGDLIIARPDRIERVALTSGLATTTILDFNEKTESLGSLALSPDGSRLAIGSGEVGAAQVRVVDLASGSTSPFPVMGGEGSINVLRFSPDGSELAAASVMTGLNIWRTADGSWVKSGSPGEALQDVAFTHDGNIVVAVAFHGVLQFWTQAGESLGTASIGGASYGNAASPARVVATPSGAGLFTLDDGEGLRQWQLSWDPATLCAEVEPYVQRSQLSDYVPLDWPTTCHYS